MNDGALSGVKVLELGQMVAAPYCAKLFADYGADVLKVEPLSGDAAREWGPFPGDAPHPEKSGLYFFLNTNKRGIALDVDSPLPLTLDACGASVPPGKPSTRAGALERRVTSVDRSSTPVSTRRS